MKWNVGEGIDWKRGNYATLMWTFDNAKVWFTGNAFMTQQNERGTIREMGKAFGAKEATVRLFDVPSRPVEAYKRYDEQKNADVWYFRNDLRVPEGHVREFKYYDKSEIFK